MVETIIEAHPLHNIIIGGDFNTELKGASPFDQLLRDLMGKFDLECSDSLIDGNNCYTYHHESLGHQKWNDHFLISQKLICGSKTSNHQILDEGDNPSDHLPILFSLTLDAECSPRTEQTLTEKEPKLKWDKLSDEHIEAYQRQITDSLDHLRSSVLCNNCHCNSEECKNAIQNRYNTLIHTLKQAEKPLPRCKAGVEKSWLTPNLTTLRNNSIECHHLWVELGRPGDGPIQRERLCAKAEYKRAIRHAKSAPNQESWNRLHSAIK